MTYIPYSPGTMRPAVSRRAVIGSEEMPQVNTSLPALAALKSLDTATPAGQKVVDQAVSSQLPSSKAAGDALMQKAGIPMTSQPATAASTDPAARWTGSLDNSMGGQVLNSIFGTTTPGQGLAAQGMDGISSMLGLNSAAPAATGAAVAPVASATGGAAATGAADAAGGSGFLGSLLALFA